MQSRPLLPEQYGTAQVDVNHNGQQAKQRQQQDYQEQAENQIKQPF